MKKPDAQKMNFIDKIHNWPIAAVLFKTVTSCLQKELKDCQSVLDLGCGPSSPLQYCQNVKYSEGVEIFSPYLKSSKKNKIHSKYLHQKVERVNYPPKSFDAVIMIELLEHLSKKEGVKIIKKAENWARKKVVISTPNGYLRQIEIDNNSFQKHLSGWTVSEMKMLGYKCNGLAGLKIFRSVNQNQTMGEDILSSIRFQPKVFWFLLATLSQLVTYYFPGIAFEIFSVKNQ